MLFYENERIGLFIDGSNLYGATRALNMEIDYKRLLDYFAENGRLIRANYYTAIDEDAEFNPLRPLVDWLDYNGFMMITKPTKEFTDNQGNRRIKGNMDVEIAVDMMLAANYLDHLVLFSGDGDFRRLVESIQGMGKRVTVISTIKSQPPMIADELRRQADHFVDLTVMTGYICKQRREASRVGE